VIAREDKMSAMLLLLLACSGTDKDDSVAPIDDSATGTTDAWPDQYALGGALTWSLDDASGDDCTFVVDYAATEDWSQPWTCPDCEVRFLADVSVDDEACYRDVNGNLPSREYLGIAPDGTFLRHTLPNFPLAALATWTLDGDTLGIHGELTSDDGSSLTVDGTLTRTPSAVDPWHGFAPPDTYACGWPKADPPPFEGEWAFHVNQTIPDGWFLDRCGEPVRLHDLTATYVVIDISAVDCPPCQLMASNEGAFEAAMANEGIDVESVTLLAPSLSAILDDTPQDTLEKWTKTYGVGGAVLADRGWGYAIPAHFLGAKNYPTWVVVAPDLRSIAIGSGYESHDDIAEAIRADAK
jgi:hypothetical protein